jgi:glutamyl-tRNA reductase
MGKHLVDSRTAHQEVSPTAVRYTLGKKLAIHADILAGLSYREIALRNGVSISTVSYVKNDPSIADINDPKVVELRKKAIANMFYFNVDRLLQSISDEDIKKMQPFQRFIASGMSLDKARLAEGLSTENISVKGVVATIASELEQMKKERLRNAANAAITVDEPDQPNDAIKVETPVTLDDNTMSNTPSDGNSVDTQHDKQGE